MLKRLKWAGIAAALALVPALTTDDAAHAQRAGTPVFVQSGVASWYGPGFHGRKTASGERFNQYQMTAAHKRLPLGTVATVTNLKNGKSVQVEINDRGPYVRGRIIDLSKAAADHLGMRNSGTTPVRLEVHEENWGADSRSS
ncbi:MAG: septal ring lytic transglycosylase RlpA family protein [Rhodospirillales bacterium]